MFCRGTWERLGTRRVYALALGEGTRGFPEGVLAGKIQRARRGRARAASLSPTSSWFEFELVEPVVAPPPPD